MLTLLTLPVQGDDPIFGVCGINAEGLTYCHPGIIGLDCVSKAHHERITLLVEIDRGFLPLVPIKWAKEHFSDYARQLDKIDSKIRFLAASGHSLN